MPDHALLSASGSHRWISCPPSALLESKFPNKTTVYAEEGTLAHSVAEACAKKALGEKVSMRPFSANKLYNAEMLEHGKEYADLIKTKLTEHRKTCEDAFADFEVRLDFSKWVPDGFGTGDCIIVADDTLEIVDYKYGKGVKVSAVGNSQMKLYALGALAAYGMIFDIATIKMTIFQPRLLSEPDSDVISTEELMAWAEQVLVPAAKLAAEGKGDFNPSEEACRFCKAKEQCRARAQKYLDLFDAVEDPQLLSPDEAGSILAQAKDMKNWLSDLENLVSSTLFSGEQVQGWKLVEGKSNRKIADEDAAAEAFVRAGIDSALLFEKKLITLTQMERDFGKKKVAEILGDLITKPQGKPTLAPESDKRPPIDLEENILKQFDE